MSGYDRLRVAAGILLLACACLALGCERPAYRGGSYERELPSVPDVDAALRLREVDWQAIPEVPMTPVWERTYEQPVTASLADDGSAVAVGVSLTVGKQSGLGYELFDPAGQTLTRVVFTGDRYHASAVRLLGGGKWVAATMTNFNQQGYFAVYDRSGRRLLARSLKGWAVAAASAGGGRLAAVVQPLGQTFGQLVLYDTARWQEAATLKVRADAVVEFAREGDLLVADADRVLLLTAGGTTIAEYRVPAQLRRAIALSPGGDLVAATTGEADSRVYVFNRAGGLVLEELLFFGGTGRLAFSENGRWLAVYDVGERGGIYLFELIGRQLAWRSLFRPPEGTTIAIRQLVVDEHRQRLVAEVVVRVPEQSPMQQHYLYIATLDGLPAVRVPLGENLDVHLDLQASTVVTTTNAVADWSGRVRNRLSWYELVDIPFSDLTVP